MGKLGMGLLLTGPQAHSIWRGLSRILSNQHSCCHLQDLISTDFFQVCTDTCAKKGESYFWCPKDTRAPYDDWFDYCSPR